MSSDAPRGLPLLSGPPPSFNDSAHAEIACRKCNKEFNFLFTRSRKCNHCGFSYCHSCTDYQALMPRSGNDTGYDSMHVCAFCIELLQITAGGKNYLKSLPLSKLKKYVNAYNIKIPRAVEKEDLIEGIMKARGPNGCLPAANENYYRRHSVPNKIPPGRPRGLFSRSSEAPPPVPPQRPTPTTPTFNFPRPDLEPDHPPSGPSSGAGRGYAPQYSQAPPPPPRPQPQQHHHYTPPPNPPPRPHSTTPRPSHQSYGYAGGYSGSTYHHQQQHPSSYHSFSTPGGPPPPPPPNSRPSTTSNDWYNAGANARPYQDPASRPQPPPPPPPPNTRPTSTTSSSAPPPAPPPSLDELLTKTPEEIGALSIGTLKSILFMNHVNARQILEKSELVRKVLELIEDEKREREEQRRREEWEEMERRQLEEERAQERERELERQRQRAQPTSTATDMQAERERNGHTATNLRAWVEEASPSDGGRVPGGSRESIVGGVVDDDGPLLELNEPREGPPSEHTDGRDSPNDEIARSATPVPPTQPSLPIPVPSAQGGTHTRSASSTSATSPPRPRPMERTGLCVVCQDEEANIAIVDCGHLAMCRGCSDLIMSSSRECPLCRTRIVTEQRLLRIFKT